MAAPASADAQWRRRRDDDEPLVVEEEGEVVRGYYSDTDTDEYYNRHSPSECDDEYDSTSSVVVPVNDGGHASTSCVAMTWGGTGKRGRSASGSLGRAVSPSAEPDHQSVAVVATAAPKPVLQPVPLAFAAPSVLPSSASGARTNLVSGESSRAPSVHNDDDAKETVKAAAAVVQKQQPVAPRRRPAPAAGRQNPDGYTCPKCGMWFATHQGLGGHSVGHKHREREITLAVKPERVHVCGDCGAEFATGVQLGGHKRRSRQQ